MSRKSKNRREVEREIESLKLRQVRGEITSAQFQRQYKEMLAQLPETPSEYKNAAEEYKLFGFPISVYGRMLDRNLDRNLDRMMGVSDPGSGRVYITYTSADTSQELTAEQWDKFRTSLRGTNESAMTGIYDSPWRGVFARDDKSIAEQAWEEHGGTVMCECESMKCELVIDITKEEYLAASTPGFRRLTHPNCPYGILNSRLMERHEKWHIWDKGW